MEDNNSSKSKVVRIKLDLLQELNTIDPDLNKAIRKLLSRAGHLDDRKYATLEQVKEIAKEIAQDEIEKAKGGYY